MAELISSKVVVAEAPPKIRNLPPIPTGLAAFIGIAARGPIGQATFVTSFAEYTRIFGSYDANSDLTLAIEDFFRNGGRSCFVVRTVHYTDITDPNSAIAVKSSVDLLDRGGVAAPAVVNSTDETWHLDPADHIDLDFDNTGTQVATIAATPAGLEGATAETYDFTGGGQTLTLKINDGFLQTVTFQVGDFAVPGAATAEEVAAAINAAIVDGQASATTSATKVSIFSDRLGTGSKVEITGGTANALLGFSTTPVTGTGNVVDTRAITATEIAAMITALPPGGSGTAVVVGTKVRLTSGATGAAAEIEVVATTSTKEPVFAVGVTLGSAAGTSNTLKVEGKYAGAYGDNLKAVISAPTGGETDEFNIAFLENDVLKETFPNVSMTDTDDNYVETIVNDPDTGSALAAVTDLDSPASTPNDLPALGTFSLTGGDDGLTGLVDTDFTGSSAGPTGFFAFNVIQDIAIGPLAPNRATATVQPAQLNYAEITRVGSMFVVLGSPAGLSKTAVVTYVGTTAALEESSEYGAFYWPRVKIQNPSTAIFGLGKQITVDPVGVIAGVYARTDGAFPGGVYRAPAGIEFGQMAGVVDFENQDVLEEATRDFIAAHRINPLTSFPGSPRFIDGHDTLKSNGNWPTVPERRGVIFIEQTIKRGMEVFRHGFNDAIARGAVFRTITAFLLLQLDLRAFRSQVPDEAFLVDVGDEINKPSEQFAGKLNADISLATNRPVKWIVLTFSQDVRALEAELARAESGT